jgi:hypothetical protein
MALQLIEGFDHFNSTLLAGLKGWTWYSDGIGSGQWQPSWITGRIGGQAFRATVNNNTGVFTTYLRKTLPGTYTSATVGFALRVNALPIPGNQAFVFAGFTAGTTQVFAVRVGSSGEVAVYGGTSGFVSSAVNLIRANVWNYLEVKVTVAGATSTVECYLNGLPCIATSTVNCGSNPLAAVGPYSVSNNAWLGSPGFTETLDYDDIYVTDTTGGVNAGYLGDVHVQTLYPVGDGANSAWAPDAGTSHYQRVSDNPPDDDTSYVSSGTVGAKDSYAFGDLPAGSGPVYGLQVNLWARKDDATVRQLKPLVRIAGTDYLGPAAFTLATSYADLAQLYDVSPASSAAWSPAEVNAAEFGVEVFS